MFMNPFSKGGALRSRHRLKLAVGEISIVKRSRERPRDAVQLIALLLKTARNNNASKVNGNHVAQYSEERVEDLKREVDEECSQIKEIVRSFAAIDYNDGAFKLTSDALLKHIERLPSRFGISLFGATLKPALEDSTFKLWRFLFDIGLFAARRGDATQDKGYTHINARDDVDLIRKPRWNDIQKYTWEINPAYRDFLLEVKRKDNLGLSLPRGGKRPRT
jgi:hypothetical protein